MRPSCVCLSIALLLGLSACSQEANLGAACDLDADCTGGLTCTFDGLARGQCSRDCDDIQACQQDYGADSVCIGEGVCVRTCFAASDCPVNTFCNEYGWCQRYCLLDPDHCDSPPACGNGVKEHGEECDGVDFGGVTCEDLGHSGGTLACDLPTCQYDRTDCTAGCGDGNCDPGEDHVNCPGDCPMPTTCPETEIGGPICINGWLQYFQDPDAPDQRLVVPAVDLDPPPQVLVYDPLAYAMNPSSAPLAEAVVDPHTGTFQAEDIQVPSTGFITVFVMDAPGTTPPSFATTWNIIEVAAGVNQERLTTWVVTAAQDADWSATIGDSALQAAGCQASQSLGDCGTQIAVYATKDQESWSFIEGVVPLGGGQQTPFNPESVFYLNSDGGSFTTPTTQYDPGTGPAGVAFLPAGYLGAYSGQCQAGSPCAAAGYQWDYIGLASGATQGLYSIFIDPPMPTE